jgi:ribosome assembly protein 4
MATGSQDTTEEAPDRRVLAQFKSEDGNLVGTPFDLPVTISKMNLQSLCNAVLMNEEEIPYDFFLNDVEIDDSLQGTMDRVDSLDTENRIEIVYQPQAVFRVRAVTRCTTTNAGHTDAVIATSFSPDGRFLASGSGDCTVRFWDVDTETPHFTCKGHKHWILFIAWAPDGKKLASACKRGEICLWNPVNGEQLGHSLVGHKQWITWLTWHPLHLDPESHYLVSSSKDCTVRIWDTHLYQCMKVLSGHTHSVTCVKSGGEGLLYTSSQDRTIKVWRATDGALCRTLQGHGHWVNTLALSTDYVIRTGAYDMSDKETRLKGVQSLSVEDLKRNSLQRYQTIMSNNKELLVSGSDDFTLFLWEPTDNKKSLARMTGHQQLINDVRFSPDMRLIASASFDKSVKLWDGRSGKFITTLRGHVSRVYQITWSADSRLLCSGSSDSTLKVWDIKARKLLLDLPGHSDEVFAVDWSPDGERVASGGRDRVLKMWRK